MAAIEDREQAVAEIAEKMEEEYDYLTMQDEVAGLNEAVRLFMVTNDQKFIFRDTYKLTLVKRSSTKWNEKKLRSLIPKNLWLKVTKQVIDPGKIDDLVRAGKLDDKLIAKALVSTPNAPYVQRYAYKEGQSIDDARAEEEALRQQLAQADTAAGAKPKKRKRS